MYSCEAAYVHVRHASKSEFAIKAVIILSNKSGDGKIREGNTENWTKVFNWILPKQWRWWASARAISTFGL